MTFIRFILAAFLCTVVFSLPNLWANDEIKVELTINGQAFSAVLYDNPTTRDLVSRLPLTVTLTRYERDFCGGIPSLSYRKDQLQRTYHNGDLAYWPPGKDFVIFVEKEEAAPPESGSVTIGRLAQDTEVARLQDLSAQTVTVTLSSVDR